MKHRFLPSLTALALVLGSLGSLPRQEKPALPKPGQPAPAFRLNDHTGKPVAIGGKSDHWSVLAFYPKAMTPG